MDDKGLRQPKSGSNKGDSLAFSRLIVIGVFKFCNSAEKNTENGDFENTLRERFSEKLFFEFLKTKRIKSNKKRLLH